MKFVFKSKLYQKMNKDKAVDYQGLFCSPFKKIQSFAQIPLNITEKIVKLASKAYSEFESQPLVLASWNDLMFIMVKNMYNMDYQAVDATSTSNQIDLATQQFLSAVSNEAANLQNPSEGYIK